MPRLLHASLLAAALSLAACDGPAFFQAPISEPGQVRHDQRLIGSWHSFGDDGVALLEISPPEDAGWDRLRAVLSFINTDPGAGWYFAEAYASEIDGALYYNTRLTAAAETKISPQSGQLATRVAGEFEGFVIIQAEIDADDRLSLRVISVKQPKAMGLKSRQTTCGEDCDETLYELSSGELAELIRTTPRDELFDLYLGPFARMETGRPVFGRAPPPPR